MIAALALLLAALQPAAPAGEGQCIRSFSQPAGSLSVERLSRNNLVVHEVQWVPSDPQSHASITRWQLRERDPWTLQTLSFSADIPLSRAPQRGVWAIMSVDGRRLERRHLGSGREIARAGHASVLYSSGPVRVGQDRTGSVPDLNNAANLTISVEEEGGAVLGTMHVRLPNWTLGRRQVDEGRTLLARNGRSRC